MNGITKIFGVMILLACLIIPAGVSAEKSDWKDSSYNFRGIRRVVLIDVTADANRGGNLFYQKLQSKYVENARKRLKCEVLTEEQARRISGGSRDFADVADLCIECNVKDWSDDYYIVPERTVWEKKTMHRRVRDRYGYWEDEEYETTVPVTYPPYRVDVSKIAVSFEVYDARTGKMVFGREDVRDRNDANAQDGMYGRICNSFFEDFAKVIR